MCVGFDGGAAEKIPITSQALPWGVCDVVYERCEACLFTVGMCVGYGEIVCRKLAGGYDTQHVAVRFVGVFEHVDEALADFRMGL